MRVLLDTHIFLWAVLEPERLPPRLRALIESPKTELLISTASAWEIATKQRPGKLPGATEIIKRYPMVIATLGATELPILSAHALKEKPADGIRRTETPSTVSSQPNPSLKIFPWSASTRPCRPSVFHSSRNEHRPQRRLRRWGLSLFLPQRRNMATDANGP